MRVATLFIVSDSVDVNRLLHVLGQEFLEDLSQDAIIQVNAETAC